MWDLLRTLCEGIMWQKSAWSLSRGSKKISQQETSEGNEKRSFPQLVRVSFGQDWVIRGTSSHTDWKDKWIEPKTSQSSISSIFISCFFCLCCLEKDTGNSKRTETLYTIETQHKFTTWPGLLPWIPSGQKENSLALICGAIWGKSYCRSVPKWRECHLSVTIPHWKSLFLHLMLRYLSVSCFWCKAGKPYSTL